MRNAPFATPHSFRTTRRDCLPAASASPAARALHDLKLPVFALIGYRSYHDQRTHPGETCLVFTEPVLDAWRIDYRLVTEPSQLDAIRAHYLACRVARRPGAAVIAEGKA